jgi:hypothetical protein
MLKLFVVVVFFVVIFGLDRRNYQRHRERYCRQTMQYSIIDAIMINVSITNYSSG